MSVVLEVSNLRKNFGRIQAVQDISFKVEKGNIYGILGPNGSGKSTTLGILLNTLAESDGNWKWFGNHKTDTSTLKKIGAILEHPNFYSYLSGEKNLKIVAKIKEVHLTRIDEVLNLVGLSDRRHDVFSTYSLGMKQRLAIASAMLNNPEVLILDEPTNGLDPEGIIQIRNLIKTISETGTTILLASHLLDEVEKICSHVIVLRKGIALYSGPVREISNTHGYFELASKDKENLVRVLNTLDCVSGIVATTSPIKMHLNKEIEADWLNETLAKEGIFLSHLVKRKQSLEEQFLELIKQ